MPLPPGLGDLSRVCLLLCMDTFFPGALEFVQHKCLWEVRSPVILPIGVYPHLHNREHPHPPGYLRLHCKIALSKCMHNILRTHLPWRVKVCDPDDLINDRLLVYDACRQRAVASLPQKLYMVMPTPARHTIGMPKKW